MEKPNSGQLTWNEMKLWSTRYPPTLEPSNLVSEYQQLLLRMNVRNRICTYMYKNYNKFHGIKSSLKS